MVVLTVFSVELDLYTHYSYLNFYKFKILKH